MPMPTTVAEIIGKFQPQGILSEAIGQIQTQIARISSVETCAPGDLVFVDKKEYLDVVRSRKPAAVVTSAPLKALFEGAGDIVVLVAPNVGVAHAKLKELYASRNFMLSGWPKGVHTSAVVHESAQLDNSVIIEPKAVVGARVQIGMNSRIMAGVVIENDVVIGDDCVIHPNVVIGYACKIGNQVVIESGTVVGSQGYGFAQDSKRKSHAIPQTGIVVLEDRVKLGANCCIDRAAYFETRIGAGTKLDNLCHIAHNVKIGEDCLLTAMLCVAGSTQIGSRVITSGQTGIIDHMKVCDDVVLLHRAGVSKDVEAPGAYAGLPLLPLKDYMKNAVVLKDAADLRKRLLELERRLDAIAPA